MELWIVRHGIAVELGTEGVEWDEDRMLSRKGRKRTEAAARGLRILRCRPNRIFSSPLVRARETAEILSSALEDEPPVKIIDALSPGGDIKTLHEWLAGLRCHSALLVGHMPDVAELAASMASPGAELDITFKKASACCLSFEKRRLPGEGCLEWLLQPRALRALSHAG